MIFENKINIIIHIINQIALNSIKKLPLVIADN